jgi:hypothetical protein
VSTSRRKLQPPPPPPPFPPQEAGCSAAAHGCEHEIQMDIMELSRLVKYRAFLAVFAPYNTCASRVPVHSGPGVMDHTPHSKFVVCRWARLAAASQELLEEGERLQAENDVCSDDDSSSSDTPEPGSAAVSALQVPSLPVHTVSTSFPLLPSRPDPALQSIRNAGFSEADALESLKVPAPSCSVSRFHEPVNTCT